MKSWLIPFSIFAMALMLFPVQGVLSASEKDLLGVGDVLPDLKLSAPKTSDHKKYLGLTGDSSFQVPDIGADVVIVEIFSMYCPHCQKEAPVLNKLYHMIEKHPVAKGKIKMIGIGVGNDIFEVDYFRKKFEVVFPLFDDEDYIIHQACGKPGTPFFAVVKINDDGSAKVVHTQLGGFESPETFLKTVLEKSGLT
jgi:thiol-disulfide isomerase/thioredoxin